MGPAWSVVALVTGILHMLLHCSCSQLRSTTEATALVRHGLAQVALLSLPDFMKRNSESLVGLSEPVVEGKVMPPD